MIYAIHFMHEKNICLANICSLLQNYKKIIKIVNRKTYNYKQLKIMLFINSDHLSAITNK